MKATFAETGNDGSLRGKDPREQEQVEGDLGGVPQRPLRILFVVHTPWTDRLGVCRVSIELGRELERMGHRCSHYAWEEAFPRGLSKLSSFFSTALFQWRLLGFLRRRGHDFDVVQVESHLAPFPRAAYGFRGILVAKSNGLPLFYERYERWERSTERRLQREAELRGSWGRKCLRTRAGDCLRALGRFASGGWGAAWRTFSTADVIHVLNRDEQLALSDGFDLGHKVAVVPNGLSEDFLSELHSASEPSARAASRTVAFVGMWALRKGRLEFPSLVRKVREACPEASFHLLGTYLAEEQEVLSAFDVRDRASIRVQPSFDPQELPALLASAKVGVFPSYVEGFPLGALEMMGAGLPVVAWDAPGSRDFVAKADAGFLTPTGDVDATGAALIRLLRLSTDAYVSLSDGAFAIASAYTWQRSAACFLDSLKPLVPWLWRENASLSSSGQNLGSV